MIKTLFISATLILSLSLMSFDRKINLQVLVKLSVIVNADGAPTTLDMKALRSVLKGEKKRWKDGSTITLAFMKTSTDVGSDMSTRIFNMTEKQLNKYFLAKVFQGKMSSPEFFDSEVELKNYVKTHKGAISVVNSENVSGFKTISIDGKKSF
jgi:hypothetical protein